MGHPAGPSNQEGPKELRHTEVEQKTNRRIATRPSRSEEPLDGGGFFPRLGCRYKKVGVQVKALHRASSEKKKTGKRRLFYASTAI